MHMLLNAFVHCIVIGINIRNQSHFFWVATGYVRAWRWAHVITLQHVHWFACTCAGMMEHSFTINSVIRGCHVYIDGMRYTNRRGSLCNWEQYGDPCAVAVKSASYPQRHLTDIRS